MADPTRILPPNYTQIPNAVFDLMADKDAGLTEAELRVILAIARKTFGWHKKRDKISLSQLEKLTAMSRPSVASGIEAAMKRGIVRRVPDKDDRRGGFFYELVVEDGDRFDDLTSKEFELVKNLNQLNNLPRTSKEFELELVKNLNPQKKEKERKERERGGREQTPAPAPSVQAYFDHYPNETLNVEQVQQIAATATDLPRWCAVLRYWKSNGHRPQSVGKMLDRYTSGRTARDDRPGVNGRAIEPHRPVMPPADAPTIDPAANSPEETARKLRALMAERKAGGT